jgi:hypothetical protein
MLANPYPLYAMLRASNPVFKLPVPVDVGAGVFLLTRHRDVQPALRDARLSADRRNGDAIRLNRDRLPKQLTGDDNISMLVMDAPDHTRVRGLVNKAFTPRRVGAAAAHQAIADSCSPSHPRAADGVETDRGAAACDRDRGAARRTGQRPSKFRSGLAHVLGRERVAGEGAERVEGAFDALREYLRASSPPAGASRATT